MNVKGTVFITAKAAITSFFGEERWNSFIAKLGQKDNYFKSMIMSVTLVPVEKHLFLLDELIKEFYNGDNTQYLTFGKVAAKFALSPGGPYHSYLLQKDLKQFVEYGMQKLWTTYYDEGVLTSKLENNVVHIKITQVPIKHVYFEYLIAGFFQQGIKIFGKKSVGKCISGFSKGNDDIYYQYEIKDA